MNTNQNNKNEQNKNKIEEPEKKQNGQQDPSQIHSNPSDISNPDPSSSVC